MRKNFDLLRTFDASATEDVVTDSDLVGYFRPSDIVEDPSISVERKRELLAHWASDIHAVAGAPALRALAGGMTVSIDAILSALRRLDELPPPLTSLAIGSTSAHG